MQLIRHTICESVLMLFGKKNIQISPCLSKLQLFKFGMFLRQIIYKIYNDIYCRYLLYMCAISIKRRLKTLFKVGYQCA